MPSSAKASNNPLFGGLALIDRPGRAIERHVRHEDGADEQEHRDANRLDLASDAAVGQDPATNHQTNVASENSIAGVASPPTPLT